MANPRLTALAANLGIATEFFDWKGNHTRIGEDTLIRVLAAMDVDASSPQAIDQALADLDTRAWRRGIPACTVQVEQTVGHVDVHVNHGSPAQVLLRLESGAEFQLHQVDNFTEPRMIDDRLVGVATFEIPDSLPLGYHSLELISEGDVATGTLIITPAFLGMPPALKKRRVWGYAAQLYSLASAGSWGIGDLTDLADLTVWAGYKHQADYVLINPLHAAQSTPPLDESPYLPTSRLFYNPCYIRPESLTGYQWVDEAGRRRIAQLRQEAARSREASGLIERDASWVAKREALEIVYAAGRRPARDMAFAAFRKKGGTALRYFATWCVMCELFGNDWREWDEEYQRPTSPAVLRLSEEHRERIRFHEWLQWVTWEQLSDAQQTTVKAGMSVGLVTDLAVGVNGSSADTWMMNDIYAKGVSVGAPPDAYNQIGQDWGQPPWRPDRLAETAYAPFRLMLRAALAHAGAVRIDHILGMFRLWWIPEGSDARQGTYVRYDHRALIGIIMLEARRSGAFVIGEDLGTVEGWVRDYLCEKGILGTSVLWFENGDDGRPVPPQHWREYAMASVVTHDLPPTAGYLAGEHIRLRDSLGVLTEPAQVEFDQLEETISTWREELTRRGFLTGDGHDVAENLVLGLYRYLVQTNSRVLNVALVDAVGDKRIQNQPGTWREYPNWRIPLSGPDGDMLTLEEVFCSARADRLAEVLNQLNTVPLLWITN